MFKDAYNQLAYLYQDLDEFDNAMWAITTKKVKIGGNAGLAMKLSDLFSAEG